MFIISKKRVSSHFPESQSSYYSTFALLMMKEDLDLSADDDDVHSWLDALNEREL
jgi:hypothetical protein